MGTFCVFEIYPQIETPEFTRIAELTTDFDGDQKVDYRLHGNRTIIYNRMKGTVVIWDFVVNAATSWSMSSYSVLDQVCYISSSPCYPGAGNSFIVLSKVTEMAILILHSRHP